MKQYRKLLVLVLLLIVSGGVLAQDLFDKAKLDNYFGKLEENNKFMGSVAVTKNGEIIYTPRAFCHPPKFRAHTSSRLPAVSRCVFSAIFPVLKL